MKIPQDEKLLPTAIKSYLTRINAEINNFKLFTVKDYDENGYSTARCIIRINKEGEILVSDDKYAPTNKEEAAIKSAWSDLKFPEAINATQANFKALAKKIGKESILYQFIDRHKGGIIMVQERYFNAKTGKKGFNSWSFWSDGEWRPMEPGDKLPFWKPTEPRGKRRIMVHEGAKTSTFVDGLVNDPARREELEKHPWGEFLKNYEHWGMIGGTGNPEKTNYDELRKENANEVVYVCDNDSGGKSVLRRFSNLYGRPMKGIMFDEHFPQAWDMADAMPEKLFSAAGKYNGPMLGKLLMPATYATDKVPNPSGKGAPITVLRTKFVDEWFHCITPEVFVHRDWPSVILQPNEFNNKVRPFSDVRDTAELLKTDAAGKTGVLKYSPAEKPGIYVDRSGKRYINTHVPADIKAIKGDLSLWEEYITMLVPDDGDRKELERWCATLIARPEIKMLYGVLLVSEQQGVGKGTLGEKILTPLIGEENVSFPSEAEVVESQFNYWAAHKRLAVVHEIYAGHSSKAYDKLKSTITDGSITVSKKYQANYDVENWVHIFACSNSAKAIKLSEEDRRWFIPRITDKKQTPAFWKKFNNWLQEDYGLNNIKWWAQEFLKKENAVMKGDDAPWSSTKRYMIEESYSPGQRLVAQFLVRVREEFGDKPVIILDTDLVRMIRDHIYEGRQNDRLERPLTVRKVAQAMGWFTGDGRAQIREWGTSSSFARVISNDPALAKRLASDVAKDHRPLDVAKKAGEWLNGI